MPKKGRRDRDWGADGELKKLKQLPQPVDWKKMEDDKAEWLYQWARDMHAWGQDVRDDIIRLEAHTGFASGDPGDPPDGPPEP